MIYLIRELEAELNAATTEDDRTVLQERIITYELQFRRDNNSKYKYHQHKAKKLINQKKL
jgi:hypothetical protein